MKLFKHTIDRIRSLLHTSLDKALDEISVEEVEDPSDYGGIPNNDESFNLQWFIADRIRSAAVPSVFAAVAQEIVSEYDLDPDLHSADFSDMFDAADRRILDAALTVDVLGNGGNMTSLACSLAAMSIRDEIPLTPKIESIVRHEMLFTFKINFAGYDHERIRNEYENPVVQSIDMPDPDVILSGDNNAAKREVARYVKSIADVIAECPTIVVARLFHEKNAKPIAAKKLTSFGTDNPLVQYAADEMLSIVWAPGMAWKRALLVGPKGWIVGKV